MLSVYDSKFQSWYQGARALVLKERGSYTDISVRDGIKYIKIIEGNKDTGRSGSAFAFINKENGDVLKPATWNTPAKHARGNIFDEYNGLKYMSAYGPAYLR